MGEPFLQMPILSYYPGVVDDADRTLFTRDKKSISRWLIPRIATDNIFGATLQEEDAWNSVAGYT